MEYLDHLETLTEAQQQLYDWLVDYITTKQHSPSIRQMMRAMTLKSPAPVQSRLEHLRKKGYIGWDEGQARTIRLLHNRPRGIPVLGAVAATSLVENFQDIDVEMLDFSNLMLKPGHFALKVRGHSMIEALIDDGDTVIMQPVIDQKTVKNGAIVAAHVSGKTTLKYYHKKGAKVILMPGNPDRTLYPETELKAVDVDVQGLLIAVWRDYK
jgi:repressor LexA